MNNEAKRNKMNEWTDMRRAAFTELEKKHGKLTQLNHEIYKKEMKRLENIWRKERRKAFLCFHQTHQRTAKQRQPKGRE